MNGAGLFSLAGRVALVTGSARGLGLEIARGLAAQGARVYVNGRDAAAVARAVAGCEVVFHNVAQVPLAKDRQAFESVNVHGTRVLLEAAQGAGVSKVVYTSSSAVFGASCA